MQWEREWEWRNQKERTVMPWRVMDGAWRVVDGVMTDGQH